MGVADVERRFQRASVPLLVLASIALLSLLAFNLRNLDPGSEELPPPPVGEPDPGAAAVQQGAGDALRVLYVVVLVSLALVVAVGVIILWRRGVPPWKLLSVWELVGFATAIAFLLIALLFWTETREAFEQVLGGGTTEETSGGTGGGSDEPPRLPFGTPSSWMLFVLLGALGALVLLFARRLLPPLLASASGEGPPIQRRKAALARTVRRAIADLESGGDFRAVVLRCYRSMVLLFEGHGLTQGPSQTAREFEADAFRAMGLSHDAIDDLTSLFEEARYSAHPIRQPQRDAAITSLVAIRRDLEAAP